MPSAMTFCASSGVMPHLNLPASSPTARALAAWALGWEPVALPADFLANAGVAASSAIAQAMRIMVVMRALYHARADPAVALRVKVRLIACGWDRATATPRRR